METTQRLTMSNKMRVLIHFDPGSSKDIFEGTRLRKNIKGSLELNGITWVDSIYARPDICHLISPIDESLAKAAKDEGVPLVISAMYTEDDPSASFLTKDIGGELTLTQKARKTLEIVDAILVPTEADKKYLKQFYPDKRMEVVSPGVNRMRFDALDALAEKAFQRYERFSMNEKYFLIVGNYEDKENIAKLKKLAAAIPECRFFFLGGKYGNNFLSLRRINKQNQKNLTFLPIIPDDIYCSAIKEAAGMLIFEGSIENKMVLLEAFAAKTPVFYIGNSEKSILLDEFESSITRLKTTEEVINFLPSFTQSNLEGTIMSAYQVAKENNLGELGITLKNIYETLINKESLND